MKVMGLVICIKIILESKKKVKFLVVLEIRTEVIIGIQTLKKWEIKSDFKEKNIFIKEEKLSMELQWKFVEKKINKQKYSINYVTN
jgi:hypothetical protein